MFTCVGVVWCAHSCQPHVDLEQAVSSDSSRAQLTLGPARTPTVQNRPAGQLLNASCLRVALLTMLLGQHASFTATLRIATASLAVTSAYNTLVSV
jgi:hypothetical protein